MASNANNLKLNLKRMTLERYLRLRQLWWRHRQRPRVFKSAQRPVRCQIDWYLEPGWERPPGSKPYDQPVSVLAARDGVKVDELALSRALYNLNRLDRAIRRFGKGGIPDDQNLALYQTNGVGLPKRTRNALVRHGLKTVEQAQAAIGDSICREALARDAYLGSRLGQLQEILTA